MHKTNRYSLWRWICLRILTLAIGTVVIIALCMWLRFELQNFWIMHQMPTALREEFEALRQHPQTNPTRFHEIIDAWWGIECADPSVASSDWIMVGVLVAVMIPFIVFMGLRSARPLAVQFDHLTAASQAVTQGKFDTQAALVRRAPEEMLRFAQDFNSMTQQLARYERELRTSHVAMAHELRSPLTAAIGRLQGMLDGVFMPEPQQLAMVMKQLQHLNRLIEELHLISLADADRLVLDRHELNLADLLRERAAWLKPQSGVAGMTINVHADAPCHYVGDAFRLGQTFTVLMENALRYASEGQRLDITIVPTENGYQLDFRDFGPGVSPNFIIGMFERFTRADSSRARHSGGSGLGLSIARAICKAHGGTITANLPAGKGLLFRMQLPVAPHK